jgi:hypothetical protein
MGQTMNEQIDQRTEAQRQLQLRRLLRQLDRAIDDPDAQPGLHEVVARIFSEVRK